MKNSRVIASIVGALGFALCTFAASLAPYPGDGPGRGTGSSSLMSVAPFAYFAALTISGWITKWEAFVVLFVVGQLLGIVVCYALLTGHGGDFIIVIAITTGIWIALWIEQKKKNSFRSEVRQ